MIDRLCTENGSSIKQVVFRNGTKQPVTVFRTNQYCRWVFKRYL